MGDELIIFGMLSLGLPFIYVIFKVYILFWIGLIQECLDLIKIGRIYFSRKKIKERVK